MDEQRKISHIEECVNLLEKALSQFIGLFEHPEFIEESGRMCFRYKDINSKLFQVLKCVRIVSGLRASLVLLKEGYVQEVGVLIRIIHEFIHDIEFIQEGHEKGILSKDQQQMIDLFYSAKMQSTGDLLSSMKKEPTVGRRKVYPTIARDLKPENPHKIQHTIKAIEEVYSGYVHGSYPHVMALYVGGPNCFYVNGMLNTSRISEWIKYLALCVHPAMNSFIGIAQHLNLLDIADELRLQRNKFEQSEAYKNT